MSYLTEQDVRDFIQDRDIEDNSLELDLSFSPEEIHKAMARAGRAYNSFPPFVDKVNPARLRSDTNIFLHATAEQLCTSLLSKLRRNDIDFTTGGVQANLVRTRIAHLEKERAEHRESWMREARDWKNHLNLISAYQTIG